MRKGKLQQSVLVRSVFKMLGQKREDAAGPSVGRGVSAFAGEKETLVFSCAPVLVKDPEDAVLAVCRVCNSVAAAGASAKGVLVSLMLPEAMEEKDLKGEGAITTEHVQNNTTVREMLGTRGIKPEELPPSEDIKKLERKVKLQEKKIAKESGVLPKKIEE